MFRRLRSDRRGVSNIIVVVLSLVIILAIASNIILWNYEMNQVDWEKMRESVNISNVEQFPTYSSWIVTQGEYVIQPGSQVEGTYLDTQSNDGSCERFVEADVGGSLNNITLIDAESFEMNWPPLDWTATGRWNKESNQAYDGIYCADFDGGNGQSGVFYTADLDCSGVESIYVDFWYRDGGCESNEVLLQYYDGTTWDTVTDLGATSLHNQWLNYQEKIIDSQYFNSDFKIRWSANTDNNSDDIYVDLVTIKKSSINVSNILDVSGQFAVNLSTYPLENIQTMEILLKFRVTDAFENWYLKAYNWTDMAYSDSGFNSTLGFLPTTGWDYYTLNFTDLWQSYVHNNGTINVKLVDQGADYEQTYVDIDFFGVRIEINGTQFTFDNDGSLTVNLVSLWVINSTDHEQYNINVFVNSAQSITYLREDIPFPKASYTVKVVTDRGNIAVYSES